MTIHSLFQSINQYTEMGKQRLTNAYESSRFRLSQVGSAISQAGHYAWELAQLGYVCAQHPKEVAVCCRGAMVVLKKSRVVCQRLGYGSLTQAGMDLIRLTDDLRSMGSAVDKMVHDLDTAFGVGWRAMAVAQALEQIFELEFQSLTGHQRDLITRFLGNWDRSMQIWTGAQRIQFKLLTMYMLRSFIQSYPIDSHILILRYFPVGLIKRDLINHIPTIFRFGGHALVDEPPLDAYRDSIGAMIRPILQDPEALAEAIHWIAKSPTWATVIEQLTPILRDIEHQYRSSTSRVFKSLPLETIGNKIMHLTDQYCHRHQPLMNYLWQHYTGGTWSDALDNPDSILSQILSYPASQETIQYLTSLLTVNESITAQAVFYSFKRAVCELLTHDGLNRIISYRVEAQIDAKLRPQAESTSIITAILQSTSTAHRRYLCAQGDWTSLTAKQLGNIKNASSSLLDAIDHRGMHESRPHKQSLFFNGSAIDLVSLPLAIEDQLVLNCVAKNLSLFSSSQYRNQSVSSTPTIEEID
ncbi:MAG: hypothetical protein VXY77_00760 [Pseudomonadota bacterium]|nr:hypothetical protein [Pseudomonadota bacterium]